MAISHSIRDKLATRAFAILIVYAGVAGTVRAWTKPLWYDELFTFALAHQSHVSTMWDALHHAADTFPPTFYVVERAVCILVRGEQVALRLAPLFGFCGLILCIFVFVRKRSGSTCALVCSAVPLVSTLYDPYAIEARGYTLSSACLALALVCYQRVDSRWWIALLALALAGAEAFHYYAVFAFLPLALAEATLFSDTRRLRAGVWMALVAGAVPLLVFWPLLASAKRYYGSDFWAQPTLIRLASVYGWFFQLPVSLGLALAFVTILWVFGSGRPGGEATGNAPTLGRWSYETSLVPGLLALPLVLFVVAKFTHSGFTERYSIPALLAFPLAAGYILPRFERSARVLFAAFVLLGLVAQEALFWVPLRHYQALSPAAGLETLVGGLRPDLPVVVSNGFDFLQIFHYASPPWAKRIVCLVDPPKARIYARSANIDNNLLVLRSYVPLPVYEFKEFAARNPDFLLYSSGDGRWDWWPSRLLDDQYTLRLVGVDEDHKSKVYLASAKAQMVINRATPRGPTAPIERVRVGQPVGAAP